MLEYRFMLHSTPPRDRAPVVQSRDPRNTPLSSAVPAASPNTTNASGLAKLFAVIAVAIALWILLSTIAISRSGWFAVPVFDDWDRWITAVASHYSLPWFFIEHVDHRLAAPKILFMVDHLAFHGRGWFLLLCSFCLQALTGIMLWRLSGCAYRRDRTESALLAALIVSCIFSAQQWMNLTLPFQIQFPMVYCFAATSLFAIWESAEQDWRSSWLAASIALAALATYSMANGILIWPVMLIAAAWLRMPRRWIAAIAAVAVFIGVSYFYNWHKSPNPFPDAVPAGLKRRLVFWFGHLGSPVGPLAYMRDGELFRTVCAAVPGALLALALLAGFLMLWRRREQYSNAYAVLIFYSVFLALSSASIAYGRATWPLSEIYSPRYLTPAYLFWASMLLVIWPVLRRAPRTALYGALCAAMLLGVAIHQRTVSNIVRIWADAVRLGEVAIVDNVTDPQAWLGLGHNPHAATMDTLNYLKINDLMIFTEEWTHWPGIPLNRRFSIDRTPGACQGEFEQAVQVTAPLRPGWRATGWAWDNKAGQSPRYVILADNDGVVAGVALTGFPPPSGLAALPRQYVASTWHSYANGHPRPITAYVLEADDRSLCAIGTRELHPSGTEVAFSELGPRLPDATPEIAGTWAPDGYYKGAGGPGTPPADGLVFGSYPDTNTGTIRLGPFHLDGHIGIAIPVVTGPDNHKLTITIRDALSKEVLAQMDPPPVHTTWWAWRPELPMGRGIDIEVLAEDKGSGWGQWMALGSPHVLLH